MPALPEPEDATRNKIDEAQYFLHQIKNRRDAYLSGQGDNELCLRFFKFFLSAFLCSARSILDYMKNQYNLSGTPPHRKFEGGYMQKGGKFRELKFFNDIRVENVHYKFGNKEPYKVRQRDQVSCGYTTDFPSVTEEEAARRKAEIYFRQEAENPLIKTESPTVSRVPIELLFLKQEGFLDQDTEVIEFCTRQIETMIRLVELCEKNRFTIEELDSFPLHP
jgi:hypothetical protein